ncbi:pirin-like C-terminal cupin domain-containing protein [Salipiger marinus]|uniref:pirin-like C-terminal cupin domain-containing protein n=1 Tax=Salipiger marinus TaxID=555512 RepID=UPI002C512C0E|nr:pirin-like C-terminal cupin domain-containing protein [Salipiger manganoxidans]MEB3419151.1 pirin-like C-terminal cupin domain-containing protein [Salipiger manganoxidans]
MTGPRYIWWTFISSSKDRIGQAKADWKAARWINGPFRLPQGNDAEVIPISPDLDRTRPREQG